MPAWTSAATPEHRRAARRPGRAGRLGCWLCVLCSLPLLVLLVRALHGDLGADPLHAAIHATGWWALALLWLTLSITPLRRLSVWVSRSVAARWGRRVADWNLLIRQRRQLGLWAFGYACLHMGLYLVLDAGSWQEAWADLIERPFLTWGALCALLLLPLAATSTQAAQRRLGRNWSRLHCLVYPAAAVGLLHGWLQVKLGHTPPWDLALLALAVVGLRVGAWRAGATVWDEGQEARRGSRLERRG